MNTIEWWANFAQILSLPISILGLILAVLLWKYPPQSLDRTLLRRLRLLLTYLCVAAMFFWLGAFVSPGASSPEQSRSQDEVAVRQVIESDIETITNQNLPLFESIYAPNASVINCQGTLNDSSDDDVFTGFEQIRERYREMITRGWRSFTLVNLIIEIDGDTATVSHQGLVVNDEEFFRHPAAYKLARINNRWLIMELRIRCSNT